MPLNAFKDDEATPHKRPLIDFDGGEVMPAGFDPFGDRSPDVPGMAQPAAAAVPKSTRPRPLIDFDGGEVMPAGFDPFGDVRPFGLRAPVAEPEAPKAGFFGALGDLAKGRQYGLDSVGKGMRTFLDGSGYNRDAAFADAAFRIESEAMRPAREQEAQTLAQSEQEGRDLAAQAQSYLKERGEAVPPVPAGSPQKAKLAGLPPEGEIYGPEGGGGIGNDPQKQRVPVEDYRTFVRRAMQKEKRTGNERETIVEAALRRQGIGPQRIDPAEMNSDLGARDIVSTVNGGAKLSTFFGDKSEDEIVAELQAMDERFAKEYLENQAKILPRNKRGKWGDALGGAISGGAEIVNPISVGQTFSGVKSQAKAYAAAAPQLQLDENGDITVVAPGRDVTGADVFRAYGADLSTYFIEKFTGPALGYGKGLAVSGMKKTAIGRGALSAADDVAKWGKGLADKPLFKAISESPMASAARNIYQSPQWEAATRLTGFNGLWDEMREELVEQVFSTPLWNVEGDSAPATERMRKAAWEFTLNAPYLALGIMTAGAMKMGAVAPFEKMARKRMASEDARQYGQVLKSLGVDNVKDGEVESFLTNLYGTQSPVRSLRMIDKFLDAHGISVTKDGPVVQAMHQAFAEQDRQLHPRDRFLRGLKEGWINEGKRKEGWINEGKRKEGDAPEVEADSVPAPATDSPVDVTTGAAVETPTAPAATPATAAPSSPALEAAISTIVPERDEILDYAKSLENRPVDALTGEILLTDDEQKQVKALENDPKFKQAMDESGGHTLLALFAIQQDQKRDAEADARERETADARETADRRPQTADSALQQPADDNLDMAMPPAAKGTRKKKGLQRLDEQNLPAGQQQPQANPAQGFGIQLPPQMQVSGMPGGAADQQPAAGGGLAAQDPVTAGERPQTADRRPQTEDFSSVPALQQQADKAEDKGTMFDADVLAEPGPADVADVKARAERYKVIRLGSAADAAKAEKAGTAKPSRKGQAKGGAWYTRDDRVTPLTNEINSQGGMHPPQWTKPGKLAGPRRPRDGNYDGIISDYKIAIPPYMGVFSRDGRMSPDQMLEQLRTKPAEWGVTEPGFLPADASIDDMWDAIRAEFADYKHWKATGELPKGGARQANDSQALEAQINAEEDARFAALGKAVEEAQARMEAMLADGSLFPPDSDVYADGLGDDGDSYRVDSVYVGTDAGIYYRLVSYLTGEGVNDIKPGQVTGLAQAADVVDFDVDSFENGSNQEGAADVEQGINGVDTGEAGNSTGGVRSWGIRLADGDKGVNVAGQRGEPEADAGEAGAGTAETGATPEAESPAVRPKSSPKFGLNLDLLGAEGADSFNLAADSKDNPERIQRERDKERDKAKRDKEREEQEQNSLFGETDRAVFYKDGSGNKVKVETASDWREWLRQEEGVPPRDTQDVRTWRLWLRDRKGKKEIKSKQATEFDRTQVYGGNAAAIEYALNIADQEPSDRVKMFDSLLSSNGGETAAINYGRKLAGLPVEKAAGNKTADGKTAEGKTADGRPQTADLGTALQQQADDKAALAKPTTTEPKQVWNTDAGTVEIIPGGNMYTFDHYKKKKVADNVAQMLRDVGVPAANASVMPWIKSNPTGGKGISMWTVHVKNVTQKVVDQMNALRPRVNDSLKKIQNDAGITPETLAGNVDVTVPPLPDEYIRLTGSVQKPLVLKKNIIEKNRKSHPDLSVDDDVYILNKALYHATHLANDKPSIKADYWALIFKNGRSVHAVVELSKVKGQFEIIGWRFTNEQGVKEIAKRAEREGGQFLITENTNVQGSADLADLPSGNPIESQGDSELQENTETKPLALTQAPATGPEAEKGPEKSSRPGAADAATPAAVAVVPMDGWRKHLFKARKYATALGIQEQIGTEGWKSLKTIAASIDQHLKASVETAVDKPTTPVEAVAPEAAPAPAPKPAPRAKVEVKAVKLNLSDEKQAQLKAIQDKLREKFKNNKGAAGMAQVLEPVFDPESYTLAAQMASLYAQGGIKTFAQFAHNVSVDMADAWDSVKKMLHGAWQSAGAVDEALDDISRTDARAVISGIDNELQQADNNLNDTTDDEEAPDGELNNTQGGDQEGSGSGSSQGASGRTGRGGHGSNDDDSLLEGVSPEAVQPAGGNGDNGDLRPDLRGEGTGGGQRQPPSEGDGSVGRPGAGAAELVSDGRGGRTGRAPRSPRVRPKKGVKDGVPATARPLNGRNFRITDPEALFGGGPKDKFSRNKAAIETFDLVTLENRAPTDAERDAMAAFIGWGSFGQELFNGTWDRPQPKDGWETEDKWLRNQLGKDAWESAQSSIINAHFTDPFTVGTMWEMVRKAGFKGGRVLEPSMGIGNFFGMMPADMAVRSELTGIEMEPTTGGMAKLLYPDANIQIKPYQDSQTPDGFYDLVIGNWPFSEQRTADRRYNQLAPTLHDYFFLKALDQVRPGGLVIGVTSAGTMDKVASHIRLEMSNKADLVASFRLPSGAFKRYAGTQVVTDIVILRKKTDTSGISTPPAWVNVSETDATRSGRNVRVNNYFIHNPQNILGDLDFITTGSGKLYGRPAMYVHRPDDFEQRMAAIPRAIPADTYKEDSAERKVRYVSNSTGDRINSVLTGEDGKLYVSRGDQMAPIEDVFRIKVKSTKETQERFAEIGELVAIRKTLGQLMDAQRSNAENQDQLRKQLNNQYDAYVDKYGFLNANGNYALKGVFKKISDPHYASLAALERNAEKDKAKPPRWEKPEIFRRSTMRGAVKADVLTLDQAYLQQRNDELVFNPADVAKLAKMEESEVIAQLSGKNTIFFNPVGKWEHADTYLSGNVRQKLADALNAKEQGAEGMERNIKDLEARIPETIPYFKIEAKLGNYWTPTAVYQQFLAELLSESDTDGIVVRISPNGWRVEMEPHVLRKPEATSQWGTPSVKFSKIMEAGMNNTPVTVKDKDSDGNEHTDDKATEAANEKVKALRDHFAQWLWSDVDRRVKLQDEYNNTFNSVATPVFDGSFLAFEGMMLTKGDRDFNLRKHQIDAVARGLVTGRGIYAHEVGTGKTFTMAGLAIESRRYGKARKPLIFAHNANSATVAREINEMYPGAKVLYVDNMDKSRREILLNQIKNDDWDAIVVPHSMVDKFALRPETYTALAAEEIAQLEAAALEAAAEDGVTLSIEDMDDEKEMRKKRSRRAKELVKARNRIKERILLQSQLSSKNAIRLEDAGIDMIIVDEAHEFKKPPLATKMRMKGLNTDDSNRSVNIMFLLNYVAGINNGRGVHLFTGTPITNTLNEIFNMMRFTMKDMMNNKGVDRWDAWFNTFADLVSDVEVTPTGEYDTVSRLSSFVNVPELRRLAGQYMDTVFADDMPEFEDRKTSTGKTMSEAGLTEAEKAELQDGRTEKAIGRPYKLVKTVVAPMTPKQQAIRQELIRRANAFKKATKKDRRKMMLDGSPNTPIRVETDASNAGLDARLFDMEITEDSPDSKVNMAIRNVVRHYNEHEKACQAIFMERGYSDTATQTSHSGDGEERTKTTTKVERFNLAKELVSKLVASGIPAEQIAIVDGKVSKERRKQIADAMNTGEIRVVIGSTQTLGTGVNMQDNLRAMHHLDAPWMPGHLEQRNGRGHRQGNKWNSVIEYRYVTEGIDGRRWQVLVIKDKFIKAFLKAKGDLQRIIEGDSAAIDDDAGGNDMLSTLSEATGDPRIMQRAKLVSDVDKLRRREIIYDQGIVAAKDSIKRTERFNDDLERSLDALEKENKLFNDKDRPFSITIGDTVFTDRKEAQAALNEKLDKLKKRQETDSIKVGEFHGHSIMARKELANPWADPTMALYVSSRSTVRFNNGTTVYWSESGTILGLEASMRSIPKQIAAMQKQVEENNKSIESLKKAVTQPFPQAETLSKKKTMLQQLDADMQVNPVPAPGWLRQPTPIGTTVMVGGKERVVSGHQWDKDNWWVLLEHAHELESKRAAYTDVKDEQGAPIYEEREFTAPELVTKADAKTEGEQDGKDNAQFARSEQGTTPAAGIERGEFDATMQAEAKLTPWVADKTTAVDSLEDLPANVQDAIERGEGEGVAFMRDERGNIRAVTLGDRSWFILDRYNDADALAGDIREEAFHRIENEFATGGRTQALGVRTYGGKWLAIQQEIKDNYKVNPGSVEFFRELAAKAYRDGLTNRSLWGRFTDGIIAAIRRLGRALGLDLAVNDAELRDYVNSVLKAREDNSRIDKTRQGVSIGGTNEARNKQSRQSARGVAGTSSQGNAFGSGRQLSGTAGAYQAKHAAHEVTAQSLIDIPSPTSSVFLSADEQRKERENLINWAESTGLILKYDDVIQNAEDNRNNIGGAEHEAYSFLNGEDPYIIRITRGSSYGHPWYATSPSQYLKRLIEFSHTFPDAAIDVVGVVVRENGHPAIVTRQPYIHGDKILDPDEFESALNKAGFIKEGAHRWMEVATGIAVEDVTPDNVLFQDDGSAKFIDVIVDSETLQPETLAEMHNMDTPQFARSSGPAKTLKHWTTPESAEALKAGEKFDGKRKAVHAIMDGHSGKTSSAKFAGPRLYLSMDDAHWGVFSDVDNSIPGEPITADNIKSANNETDESFYDYTNQQWMVRRGAKKRRELAPVDYVIRASAKTIVIGSKADLEAAQNVAGVRWQNGDLEASEAFWKGLKAAGYDVVEVRNTEAMTKEDRKGFFASAGHDQAVILNMAKAVVATSAKAKAKAKAETPAPATPAPAAPAPAAPATPAPAAPVPAAPATPAPAPAPAAPAPSPVSPTSPSSLSPAPAAPATPTPATPAAPALVQFKMEESEGLWQSALDFAYAAYQRMRGKMPSDKNARPDITFFDLFLSRIDHYSEKVPGLRLIYNAAVRWMDNKHRFENSIFNNGENGEGTSDLKAVHDFSIKGRPVASKINPVSTWQNPEWKRLEEYLWTQDLNASGYRIVENDKTGGWKILSPDGKPVKRPDADAARRDDFMFEHSAWTAAHEMEANDLLKRGFSPDAAKTLLAIRRINDRAYAQLLGEVQAARDELGELGVDFGKVKRADGEMVDLFEALREMGDRRGHYMPRMRQGGKYLLMVQKLDAEGNTVERRLEKFDWARMRDARAIALSRKGFKLERHDLQPSEVEEKVPKKWEGTDFKMSDRPAESSYMDAGIVALNDILQKGIEQVRKRETDGMTLESVGLKGYWVDYETKDGNTEKHFVIEGPTSKGQHKIFMELGGVWWAHKGSTEKRWRFMNAEKKIEKRILYALLKHETDRLQVSTFAETITEHVADLIHQRGSRSHKIGRSDATGKDVWLGYETDALRAITVSGKSIAGGTAKRIMAKEFMRAITGQTESWMQYRQRRMNEFTASRTTTTAREIDDAAKEWYMDYAEEIAERRIDSATQPHAYNDALSFARDMLRNAEGSERVIGTIKGLAAVKFMSSPASGLVNFTSMYTHVPAAMSAFADVNPFRASVAVSRAINDYRKFVIHEKYGKGGGLQGEDLALYKEIIQRGWNEAQLNHEALAVLQSKIGAGMQAATNAGMYFYGTVERLNRVSTIAATYREIKAAHKGAWTPEDHEAALQKAHYVSDKANSIFGKTALPAWARGSSLGAQTMRSWYMFKSFPHNTFLLMKEAGFNQKDIKAAAWLMVAPGIVGGLAASMGAKFALWLATYVWEALAKVIPGIEPPDDPEEAFYQWVSDTFGDYPGRIARYGIAGAVGINIKGSLENRLEDWMPTTVADLLGAPFAATYDVGMGLWEMANGNILKGAEQASPRLIANALRAYREATEGATGRGNQPLYYGMKPIKANAFETILRATGFNPATLSEMRETQWSEKQVDDKYKARRSAFNARVRAFTNKHPDLDYYEREDHPQWKALRADIKRYNKIVEARGLAGEIPFYNDTQIQTAITIMNTPPKRERLRAMREQDD